MCDSVLIWTPYELFLNQGEIINTIILNISTCCGDVIIGPLNWGDAATVAVAQLVLVLRLLAGVMSHCDLWFCGGRFRGHN